MYEKFEDWLNSVCEEEKDFPGEAINFNIYENEDSCWSVQLITADDYDEEDDDWCCEEAFSTEDNQFIWKQECNWEEIQDLVVDMIERYLQQGRYRDFLKKYVAITAGFVDGDLILIYKKS